jgi:S-adenosyl-L-methionine methyltransferase
VSRLDSFIRRLQAQRTCLDWACDAIRDLSGPVLELGLGNGRTYDHLRSRLGEARPIFAFDRQLAAHPLCVPGNDYLVLGDFADTLPKITQRLRGPVVALVHADTGSGDNAASRAQAERLVPLIDPLLASGGIVVSDQDMAPRNVAWVAQSLPGGVEAGRYFIYRKR